MFNMVSQDLKIKNNPIVSYKNKWFYIKMEVTEKPKISVK